MPRNPLEYASGIHHKNKITPVTTLQTKEL